MRTKIKIALAGSVLALCPFLSENVSAQAVDWTKVYGGGWVGYDRNIVSSDLGVGDFTDIDDDFLIGKSFSRDD